jgi:zinc transporter ZupT
VTQRLLNDSREFGIEKDEGSNSHGHAHTEDSHKRAHSQSRQLSVNDSRSRMDSCEVGAVVAVFANANDPRALLKAYVLEGAIAVHSIIMGISLGSMQNDELSNIKILMIAYAVHQFLEGISLGYDPCVEYVCYVPILSC